MGADNLLKMFQQLVNMSSKAPKTDWYHTKKPAKPPYIVLRVKEKIREFADRPNNRRVHCATGRSTDTICSISDKQKQENYRYSQCNCVVLVYMYINKSKYHALSKDFYQILHYSCQCLHRVCTKYSTIIGTCKSSKSVRTQNIVNKYLTFNINFQNQ